MIWRVLIAILVTGALVGPAQAQFDEDQLGGWYIYQWTVNREASTIGFQGDFQHRNWDLAGDLEQLLLRGGVTWQPAGSATKYTFGYAHVRSGVFGNSGATTKEHRLYQEALIPQRWGARGFVTHRLRFEQRDVYNQDLRTRLRYLFGYNHVLNADTLGDGAVYVALSNELFLNGERSIGLGREVSWFDRNRASLGLGYSVSNSSRVQLSYMRQHIDGASKGQLLLHWIQTF